MVRNHQKPAGLERRKQLLVHLDAIDRHIGRVVIEEQKVTRSRLLASGGNGSSNGWNRPTMGLPAGVFVRASKAAFARAEVGRILPVDHAVWPYRARHQLGAVAPPAPISSTFMPGRAPMKVRTCRGSRRASVARRPRCGRAQQPAPHSRGFPASPRRRVKHAAIAAANSTMVDRANILSSRPDGSPSVLISRATIP